MQNCEDTACRATGDRRRLFVANLPARVSVADVAEYFSKFGRLESVQVGHRGFGFISYVNLADAECALNWSGRHLLADRCVVVDVYRSGLGDQPPPSDGGSSENKENVRDQGAAADSPSRRLYVKNLPPGATLFSLRQFFERFGAVDTVYVLPEKRSGFVTFASAEIAAGLLRAAESTAGAKAAAAGDQFVMEGFCVWLGRAFPKMSRRRLPQQQQQLSAVTPDCYSLEADTSSDCVSALLAVLNLHSRVSLLPECHRSTSL